MMYGLMWIIWCMVAFLQLSLFDVWHYVMCGQCVMHGDLSALKPMWCMVQCDVWPMQCIVTFLYLYLFCSWPNLIHDDILHLSLFHMWPNWCDIWPNLMCSDLFALKHWCMSPHQPPTLIVMWNSLSELQIPPFQPIPSIPTTRQKMLFFFIGIWYVASIKPPR